MELTQEYLKSVLDYNPETGELKWKRREGDDWVIKNFNARLAGKTIKTVYTNGKGSVSGYKIGLHRRNYLVHRIIFFMVMGRWPLYIDHKNRNPLDNRWVNLRECTAAENNRNKTSGSGSSSKYLGVTRRKRKSPYQVTITIEGKVTYLGSFSTEIEAAMAYDKAAKEHYGEFANLNFKD